MLINNYFDTSNTIIALSTPPGKGAIGIIRISGNLSKLVCEIFFNKKNIIPRKAEFVSCIDPDDKSILDNGILIFFKSPNSFTGENIVEFQGHGNDIILNNIINKIISKLNIKLALPGEFSSRALINKKIDIIQAESILELINSDSISNAKLALKSLQGELTNKLNYIYKKINYLIILLESSINFSENMDYDLEEEIKENKIFISNKLNEIIYNFNINKNIKKGINISIIGKPNVGKSTIFNLLINSNKSIISSIPGTTRDLVNKTICLNNINFNIFDTAGIHYSNNKLDRLGIKKTIQSIYNSDYIIYVTDEYINEKNIYGLILEIIKYTNIKKSKIYKIPFVLVKNKSDIYNENIRINNTNICKIIYISAKNNIGINFIINHLKSLSLDYNIENNYFVNLRQYKYIEKCLYILKDLSNDDLAIFSDNLKEIRNIISIILYKDININNNDILNNIFSKFCIGK